MTSSTLHPLLNLTVGLAEISVAFFILLEARRLKSIGWGLATVVAVFFVLDGLVAVNRSELLWARTPTLVQATLLDAAAACVLVPILCNARRIARSLTASINYSRIKGREYERARRDYAQLVRHRMMNPLTVIQGAAMTLQDPVIQDEEVRASLLQSVLDAAKELECMTLEPEQRDGLEHELEAVPKLPSQLPVEESCVGRAVEGCCESGRSTELQSSGH